MKKPKRNISKTPSAGEGVLRTEPLAQVGPEAKPKPGRWEIVGKCLETFQKLLAAGGALAGFLAIMYLLTVGQRQRIVVDKFSVAEDIKKAGYDEGAIARELADRIRTMAHETTSLKDQRATYSYDHEPLVEIEESSLTVKSIAEVIDRIREKRRYVVTGEVTHIADHDITMTIRPEDFPAATVTVPIFHLDQAIDKSAEYVLSKIEPYIYAAHLLSVGRQDEALKWIHLCLDNSESKDEKWYINLWGVYLLESNQLDEAIVKFRHATDLAPDFGIAYLNWALALENAGKSDDALAKYRIAAVRRVGAGALAGEGRMLTKLGHVGEAIETLTTAVRTAPHERTLRVTLAQAYIANEQFKEALQELQAARDIGEFDCDIEQQYAAVLDSLGFSDQAIAAYRNVVSADPQADLAKARLETLTKGSLEKP
jgi:tetratricopeptide (TPR) repeat protein